MSTQASYEESRKSFRLLEEKTSKSCRPLTPPCRRVIGEQNSEGLLVLPPDTSSVQFSSPVRVTSLLPRRRSADRIERKLHSVKIVERSNSAGGRLTDEKYGGYAACAGTTLNKENINVQVHDGCDMRKLSEKSEQNVPESIEAKVISNGSSETNGDNSSLECSSDPPLELTAEFLSCVMREDYQKALVLCEEILSIDPENKTCLEFQDAITEKLKQDELSEEDEESDDSEGSDSETSSGPDEQREEEEEDVQENEDTDESSGDEDGSEDVASEDEESGQSSSESESELPSGSINLLMGGLPLRTSSKSHQTDEH